MAVRRRNWRRQPPKSTLEQRVRARPRTDWPDSPTTRRKQDPNSPNSDRVASMRKAHGSWVSWAGVGEREGQNPHITQRSIGVGRERRRCGSDSRSENRLSGPTPQGSRTPSRTARRSGRWAPVVAGPEGHESGSTIVVLANGGANDVDRVTGLEVAFQLPPGRE